MGHSERVLKISKHPLSRFSSTYRGGLPKRYDVRTRHPKLLELEGWFTVEPSLTPEVAALYSLYKAANSQVKFTRWLLRTGKLDEAGTSKIGKLFEKVDVKLSCRHNDLLRLAETKHYTSCFSATKVDQPVFYLADPDVAVLFVADASGKYKWRTLIRLVYDLTGHFALVVYKEYGNGPGEAIFKALKERAGLSVYKASSCKKPTDEGTYLYSPTVHNIRELATPVWTDHLVKMNKQKKIGILVEPTPL